MEQHFKLEIPSSRSGEQNVGSDPVAGKNVIVLTKNFNITRAQENLLNKGLTFIPTLDVHKKQKAQLQLDMQEYHRKIKLMSYFDSFIERRPKPFIGKSSWVPHPDKIHPRVNQLITKDREDFNKYFKCYRERRNLKQNEVKALRELINDKNIVIKPADKGSTIVIMGRDQYIQEGERQLNNSIYYKKLDEPIYLKTIPIVHKILDKLWEHKFINSKQRQYLKGQEEPRPRRFYLLPKIHKDPNTWPVPFATPAGRPIVSDCGSETYRTAEFIDFYLNPLSLRHTSYIKDTYHFVDIVKGLSVPKDSIFFSIDVESLYTNIDTGAGIAAVKKIFKKYPDVTRPDKEILHLLMINLMRNDFEFNEKFYLQIKGTAMGKKFSPAYANIFMAVWEEEAFAHCPERPLHYWRYLDDIWGIWTGSREGFQRWFDILNSHDPSIKLQYTLHSEYVNFLDTTVYKGPSFDTTHKLDIKVFFKETDTHALLFKSSFHPAHTYKGLIKSQLIRFRRICSREDDFLEAVRVLFTVLRRRGYARSFLRDCLKTFQVQKEPDPTKIIPLVTTFSKMSTIMNNRLKTNFQDIIGGQKILDNHKIISAYRRNKNLKDLLVHARLKPIQQRVDKNKLISNFCTLPYVKNRINKNIFRIRQRFNPRSNNCIYMIFCVKCGAQYIGETKNSISVRMYQHRYNIYNKKEIHTLLVKHFILHGWRNLRVAGLQRNVVWTDNERRKCERRWIFNLGTREASGLNERG